MPAHDDPKQISLPVVNETDGPAKGGIARSRMSPIRFGVLILIQLLIIAHVIQWLATGTTIAPIEPSESMDTVKYGVITAGFIFFVLALASTAILGRWFCGWGCHVLLLQDGSAKLLNRFGIKPKPFRSRLLMLIPLILALYMFVWPLFYRFVVAKLFGPELTWPGFSLHLTTSNFWQTFPGLMVAIPFLLVCGFLVVYLLGMKGYCTYGCPYGGFFAPIDKVATGRIRVNDDCEHCGHCTAVCTSNVRVHEEVRDFKMVIDPGCMKCMDCVSVCPNDALSFGFGKPTAFTDTTERTPRKWDLSWPEEICFGVLALACFLSVRGAYGLIPLLFASGITVALVFIAWKSWQCLREANVRLHSWQLKRSGKLRPAGSLLIVGTAGLITLMAHTGLVNAAQTIAQYHDGKVTIPAHLVFNRDSMMPDEKTLDHARKARYWFELSSYVGDGGIGIGWPLQSATDNRIAWLLSVERRLDEAKERMHASIERYGISPQNAAGIARIMNAQGDTEGAEAWYRSSIEQLPQAFDLLDEYVVVVEAEGRPWESITYLRERIAQAPAPITRWLETDGPASLELIEEARGIIAEQPWILGAVRRLSIMLMNHAETGFDLQDGVELIERTLEAEPDNPFAYRALALGYAKQDRLEDAADALRNSIRLEPDELVFRQQLIDVLTGMGKNAEAEEEIRKARELQDRLQ
jgi:ferredoxin-type protein NapH